MQYKKNVLGSLKKDIKNLSKGFTLIELLVVIAIIGILATIVLTSLGNARSGANDSKIKGQLSNMRAQAQLYTGTSALTAATAANATAIATTTTGVFTDGTAGVNSLYNLLVNLPSGTAVTYYSDANAPSAGGKWAIAAVVTTPANSSFCVDYTGAAKSEAATGTSALSTSNYTCN